MPANTVGTIVQEANAATVKPTAIKFLIFMKTTSVNLTSPINYILTTPGIDINIVLENERRFHDSLRKYRITRSMLP